MIALPGGSTISKTTWAMLIGATCDWRELLDAKMYSAADQDYLDAYVPVLRAVQRKKENA